jgi:dolichol-phosphate mannosyltransferase
MTGQSIPTCDVSIVVPARDEAGNIAPLVAEIVHAMAKTPYDYELILVDDGSGDTTTDEIRIEAGAHPAVRGVSLARRADGYAEGQSAALGVGLRMARGHLLVTLDADLQNDPAEIPRLLELLTASGADMVQGDRTASRCDGAMRRVAGRVGRIARRVVLADPTRDTGCTLRVFRRPVLDALPFEFAGMHRFVPWCARLRGHRVIETPVTHRPRVRGLSKVGAFGRGIAGTRDLLAMRWMRARLRQPMARALGRDDEPRA